MTGLSDATLWNRIESWQFDKPDVSLPFSGRLARETGWEPEFARAVIDEYRRFIYLACISDGIVTALAGG